MKTIPMALMAVCTAAVCAGTPDFQASFDQDFHGLDAKGAVVTGKHAQAAPPALSDGKIGKSALIGVTIEDGKKTGFNVTYPGAGLIDAKAGTVSFWCRSLDWDVRDRNYRVFFRAMGPNSDLIVYKVPDPMICFLIGPRKKEDGKFVWTDIRGAITHWKKGEWHHVAVTWSDGKGTLYLDGKAVRTKEIARMPEKYDRFGAGGLYPTSWRNPGHSEIDELKVYKRALTADEIAGECNGGLIQK